MLAASLGDTIKVEAWLLQDLVYCFSRAIKRGRWPREEEFIALMKSGDIPEPSLGRRFSSPLDLIWQPFPIM